MKINIVLSTLTVGIASMLTSCLDLDVVQPSQFTSASMWTEENDFASAIDGAYTLMRDAYSFSNDFWGDYRANLWTSGKVNSQPYATTGENKLIVGWSGSDWAALYKTVNQANLVLKHINDIDFDSDETKNEYLAQAYFVRAHCYYDIVRIWGDAPLCLNPFESEKQEDMYPSRNPATDVYAQVESDIEEALKLMPKSGHKIHQASPGAINMLRADYYLWKASRLGGDQDAYYKALESANAVIGMDYAMLGNFANVFSPTNKTNSELIFTYPYNVGENVTPGSSPNYYAYFLAQTEHIQILQSYGYSLDYVVAGTFAQYAVPNNEYLTFLLKDPQDQRGAASVRKFDDPFLNDQLVLNAITLKFAGSWENNTRIFDCDMPVYRLPEAYIFKAEALNGLGDTQGAMDALNVIEKRARGVDNYYTGLSKNDVTLAIIDEVKMEFVAEGKTWWTILRNNKEFEVISTLVGRENEKNVTLWPVSQNSLNTNKNISQTEGY